MSPPKVIVVAVSIGLVLTGAAFHGLFALSDWAMLLGYFLLLGGVLFRGL